MAKRERRTRHLAAARYFEGIGDDELAGALATHYVAAHEASAAGAEADAVAIQARLALSGAAERAATLGAHEQAVSYLRQAIVITADPGERAALYLRAATSADSAALHDQAEALVREGIDLARAAGDAQEVGAAEALLGEILIDSGQTPEAVEVLEAAIAGFPEMRSDEVRATLLANLSRALMRTGQPAKSIAAADVALDIAEHLGLERLVAETFNNKGASLSYLGRRREGQALLQAAVDVAHAGGFVAAEIRAMINLGSWADDQRQARDSNRAAAELARRVGNRNMALWAAEAARLDDYFLAEDWDAALAEGADDRADDPGSTLDEIRRIATSSTFLIARGEPTDLALARLEILSTQSSNPFAAAAVHLLRSDRAWLAGDFTLACDEAVIAAELDEALHAIFLGLALRSALWGRDLARARELADRLDADRSTALSVETNRIAARAGIAALEGRLDEAIAGYREALSRYRSIGGDFNVALMSLDFVILVGGDHPATREAAAEARAIFERVKAGAYLERLEAALVQPAAGATLAGPSETRAVSTTSG
jgi:tetratricopeptide (TPR) repeat protein